MKSTKPNTIGHAAITLGVTDPTVYKLIREGKLRAMKVGRGTRITPEALADCIAELERECPLVMRMAGVR